MDDGGSATAPYYYVYGYEGTDVADAQATANYDTYGVLYNWLSVFISNFFREIKLLENTPLGVK